MMWWVPACLSALFAAFTAVFVKLGVQNGDSDLATPLRTVVVPVLAWGVVLAKGRAGGIADPTAKNGLFLMLSGLATGGSWLFYFKALQAGTVAQAALVDTSSLALPLLLAALLLGEPISPKVAIGTACILVGTSVIIL